MMNKIIMLLAITFALSACGATPTAVDAVPGNTRDAAIGTTDAKVTVDEPGLGTIAYNERTRTRPCKKRRKTGSHLYTTDCAGRDSGSRPVKQGDWNSLGRYVVTGNGRPD